MIQPTDLREKQLLFIDTRAFEGESGIRFQNDHIVFTKNGKTVNKASCHKLLAVFVIGELSITSVLLRKGIEHGVSFFFLNSNYMPYATIGAYAEGNYVLRSKQYAMEDVDELVLAKHIVANKIKNQARLLGKVVSDSDVGTTIEKVFATKDNSELLGIEGSYASMFFKNYFKDINWRRRAPRSREDIPNLLLDIGYTVLFNFCEALLRSYGFDVYKGVYHQLFFARKSLVTDIEEPMRCLIDKALSRAYALGMVNEKDFIVTKSGEYMLPWEPAPKYYRIFSEVLMDRKEEIYDYISAFYRHVMCPSKNKLLEFNINKNYKDKK